MSEENKAIVSRFYQEVWNGGNLDAADEFMAPDFVCRGTGSKTLDHEGYKQYVGKAHREDDLRTLGMLVHKNGETVAQAVGAAALGGPARAVAWLARKLTSFGVSLNAGDVVLSGALGGATNASKGDTFVLETHGQLPLTVGFV